LHEHSGIHPAFFRLIETTVLVVVTFADFQVLRILSPAYLRPLPADELPALAGLSIAAHHDVYNVGLVMFGIGFCALWLKSGYVPKALAIWGVLASLLTSVESGAGRSGHGLAHNAL
jgi:hypothetical protein